VDAPDRDVPRVDDHAHVAGGLVGRVDDLAGLEPDARQAVVDELDRTAEQVGAGERRDERVGRLGHELGRRAELPQAALDEHADGLRQSRGVFVVVCDDQRRQPELGEQLLQFAADGVLRVRVERGERLVEQQHARIARERPRQRDALPLAARELAGPCVGEVRDSKALEHLPHALLAAERDIALDGQVREERVLLEDEPDAPLLRRPARRRVEPDLVAERDAAARPREPGDRAQRRALARA